MFFKMSMDVLRVAYLRLLRVRVPLSHETRNTPLVTHFLKHYLNVIEQQ